MDQPAFYPRYEAIQRQLKRKFRGPDEARPLAKNENCFLRCPGIPMLRFYSQGMVHSGISRSYKNFFLVLEVSCKSFAENRGSMHHPVNLIMPVQGPKLLYSFRLHCQG